MKKTINRVLFVRKGSREKYKQFLTMTEAEICEYCEKNNIKGGYDDFGCIWLDDGVGDYEILRSL